jgi:hypothetical protein
VKAITFYLKAAVFVSCAVPSVVVAQQPSLLLLSKVDLSHNATETSRSDVRKNATPATSAGLVSKPGKEAALTARWLDLTSFSHSQRYRNQYGNNGYHYWKNGQEKSLLAGKLKIDAAGKYAIGFRASSGRSFNWAYADYAGRGFTASLNDPQYSSDVSNPTSDPTVAAAYYTDPAGYQFLSNIDSAGWEFYVRELYLDVKPVKQVTLEIGSFGFERGFSSEITTFDDDGYIAGERVRINDPKQLYLDQVTLTSAYFGSFDTPNLFARGDGFTKSNYRQLAVKKQLNARVGMSSEYNWISNHARTHTVREAIVVDVKESKVLDRFRVEGYEMLSHVQLQADDEAPRQGFAIVGEKKFRRLSGDFGFASIDRNYGLYSGSSFAQEVGFSLNGDNYNTGIRIFSHLNYKVTPVISAFGFYTRITGKMITNLNAQGLNAGLSFDLKALANTSKRIF